jgi:hypothetical protein
MIRIINGKKYNTETATLVDSYQNTYGYSDFRWCEEKLYIKKTGEFFLAGEGGAMSRWARSIDDNCTSGGKGIQPLSREEALEWLECYSDADTIEKYFPEIEE